MIRDHKLNSERKGRKGLKYRISRGGRVVSVELDKVVEGDQDAHQVHQDPQEVQDVVPVRALKMKMEMKIKMKMKMKMKMKIHRKFKM